MLSCRWCLALPFVTEHLLLSPRTSWHDSFGIFTANGFGALGARGSRETWPRSQWRGVQGKGQEPSVPAQSTEAAPAPLSHVFLSLNREQLDLKKKKIVCMWMLDPLCLCPEAVRMMRTQILYFRELCCPSDLFSKRGGRPSLMRPSARWAWPSFRTRVPALSCFCHWRVSSS